MILGTNTCMLQTRSRIQNIAISYIVDVSGRNIFDNWKKYLQLANLFTNKKILVITTFLFLMYKLIINNYDNFETVSLTQILRTNICSLTTSFFHEVVSVVVDKQEYILCPWKKISKKGKFKTLMNVWSGAESTFACTNLDEWSLITFKDLLLKNLQLKRQ